MEQKTSPASRSIGKRAASGGIFVIGAVLLVVAYIFFSIGNRGDSGMTSGANYQILFGFNYSVEGAQDLIDLCLKRSTTYNLLLFGRRGGVVELTDPFVPKAKTSLLLDGGAARAPDKESAQKELSDSIKNGMDQCVAGLALFKNRGFDVTENGELSVRVSITSGSIESYYTYPFTITKGKKQKSYQNFAYKIPVRLGDMIDESSKIINFAKERPEDADLYPLMDSGLETIFFGMNGSDVVVIRDLDSNVDGAPYEFWFGMRK